MERRKKTELTRLFDMRQCATIAMAYLERFPLLPGVGLGSEAGADSSRCHQRTSRHEGYDYEARCNSETAPIVLRGVCCM